MSIMSAPRASTSSRAASGSKRDGLLLGVGDDPASGVAFFDLGELDDAAPIAEGFANAIEAFFILHVHAAEVGGEVEVVGDEDEDGLGVGGAEVAIDGGELFLL